MQVKIKHKYYVNSEGARSIEPSAATKLAIAAYTQADDGMPLGNYLTYTASHPKELPDNKSLNSDIHAMIDDLSATRMAPVAEDYSGPILFVGQAAGELFGQDGNYTIGVSAYDETMAPYITEGEDTVPSIYGFDDPKVLGALSSMSMEQISLWVVSGGENGGDGGGNGGDGGQGGGGGGGCGGNTYGIYAWNIGITPNYCDPSANNDISYGTGGAAGIGGTSFGNTGTDGQDGVIVDCEYQL